jgi:5-methylcytosine-specific restriction endonuclease McrA
MFLAVVSFIKELVQKDELVKFTLHRAKLEEILIGKGNLSQQILSRYGGWKKSLEPIKKLLWQVLDGLDSGKSEEEILNAISGSTVETTKDGTDRSDSWKETRSATRIKASLAAAQRCAICKARLVLSHASDDHVQRRADGGHSGQDNVQLTHHYCNHGFKEHYAHLKQPMPEISSPV